MSKDDPYYLELLSSLPNDVRRYSVDIADSVDRHFENVAAALRDTLSTSTWIPESARPSPPPRLPPPTPPILPTGLYERAQEWILNHKVLTAALVAGVGSSIFLVYRNRRCYSKKRRARRASNGARKEVVVLAGSPNEPITRSLSLDLERRGFIVYVLSNSPEEDALIHSESRVDIRPLTLNITDPLSTSAAIAHFNSLLLHPQHAFPGSHPHNLHFAGLVLVPDPAFPTGPLETISPDLWSDTLNIKLLSTIATTQAFLRTIIEFRARILLLTPSIVSSLSPPFHGPESAVVSALESFATSLRGELGPLGIDVCQFRLGTFDCGAVGGRHHLQVVNATRADVLSWGGRERKAYGKNYTAQAGTVVGGNGSGSGNGNGNGAVRGSHLRELHNAVFDALTREGRVGRVWHVGVGSRTYAWVGRWVPAGLVAWMMGIRSVRREEMGLAGVGDEQGLEWERVEKMV